jgi:hypothetical protein
MDFKVQAFAKFYDEVEEVSSSVSAGRSMNYVAQEFVKENPGSTVVDAYLPSYEVTFEGLEETQTVKYGKTTTAPEAQPTKPGYAFKGWDFDFLTVITGEIEVKAIWEELKTVEVATAEELATEAAKGNVNMKLTSNITLNYNQVNGVNQTCIETLSTILDGNGHTVTINVTCGSEANENVLFGLVQTVNQAGVLKNLKVNVNVNQIGNNASFRTFVNQNDGLIENVEFSFNWTKLHWVNASGYYMGYTGSGVYRNIVAYSNSVCTNTANFFSGAQLENVLVVGDDIRWDAYSKTNSAVIANADAYATSGFDATKLDSNVWDTTNGIPTLK